MAGPLLKAILKDKTNLKFFNAFIKSKSLGAELTFVMGTTRMEEVYDTFFNKAPQVKLKMIDGIIKKAQRTYDDVMDACAKKGMKPSQAHPIASNNKVMVQLYEAAKRAMTEAFETKVIPAYQQSDFYDKFVESQIDGPLLAQQLKFPASAAKDLATAKYFMVIGKKNNSKSYIKSAIDYWMQDNRKNAKKRDGIRLPKEADVMKSLEKIKVAV